MKSNNFLKVNKAERKIKISGIKREIAIKVSNNYLEIIYYIKNPKNEFFGWPKNYSGCGIRPRIEIGKKSGYYLGSLKKQSSGNVDFTIFENFFLHQILI